MRRLQQYTYQLFVSSCSAQVNLFILPVPTQFSVTCMPIVASAGPESASAQATNPRSAAAASSILGFSMCGFAVDSTAEGCWDAARRIHRARSFNPSISISHTLHEVMVLVHKAH